MLVLSIFLEKANLYIKCIFETYVQQTCAHEDICMVPGSKAYLLPSCRVGLCFCVWGGVDVQLRWMRYDLNFS